MSLLKIWRMIRGDWIDDMLKDVRKKTDCVCDHVDQMLERAQLDGEDGWFLPEGRRPRNKTAENNHSA